MSLMDRNKRVVAPAAAPRAPAPPAASAAPVDRRVSRAAAAPPAAPPLAAARGAPIARTLIGCAAITAAIGCTGSPLVASLAFALAAGSATLTILDRPARLRAAYARQPGVATAVHVALVVGALAAWSDGPYQIQRLRLKTEPPPELGAAAAGGPARDAVQRTRLALATQQLRALLDEAQAATQARDWQRAAAALAKAVVIKKAHKPSDTQTPLDPELLRELEAVATRAADAQHEEETAIANSELRKLVNQAEAHKAAERWHEAKTVLDQAQANQRAHEKSAPDHPLERSLTERSAALASAVQTQLARQAAEKDARAQAEQLHAAYRRAEQLIRAQRRDEAREVLTALLGAIADLPAETRAAWPSDSPLEPFRASLRRRVQQLAAGAHARQ